MGGKISKILIMNQISRNKLYITGIILFTVLVTTACTSQPPSSESPNTIEQSQAKKEEISQKREEDTERKEEISTFAQIQQMQAEEILDTSHLEKEQIDALFYAEEIQEDIVSRIENRSYKENDLIALDDLRYLRVLHMGFDGQTHVGELIVNRRIAEEVLDIMKELYEQQYPIEKMVLIDEYGAEDETSMRDNNTSAFNYRLISGTNRLSKHGQGLAIDINPKYNPCVRTRNGVTTVEPQNGTEYADRTREFSYKITGEDICCQIFKEHGFTWGGDWNSLKDYQHFEWGE